MKRNAQVKSAWTGGVELIYKRPSIKNTPNWTLTSRAWSHIVHYRVTRARQSYVQDKETTRRMHISAIGRVSDSVCDNYDNRRPVPQRELQHWNMSNGHKSWLPARSWVHRGWTKYFVQGLGRLFWYWRGARRRFLYWEVGKQDSLRTELDVKISLSLVMNLHAAGSVHFWYTWSNLDQVAWISNGEWENLH